MPKKATISVEGSRAIGNKNFGVGGVLNFPVKVYSATTTSEVRSMKQICPDCKNAISKKNFCGSCQHDVEYGDLKKAYKLDKETMVEIEPHEIDYVKGELVSNIKTIGFVDAGTYSALYYEKPYFLCPESADNYPHYNLLVKGLKEYKKQLLVRFALRSNPVFALVRPEKNRLVLHTIRYDNEVRDIEKIPIQPTQTTPEELAVFKQIMENMPVTDKHLENDIEQRFQDLIEKKVNGEEIDIPKPKQVITQSDVSLLDQLKAQAQALEEA